MSHSKFGELPPELVLQIFHFAAASSRETCLSLCLVSSWIRHLALSHLLTTITFDDSGIPLERLHQFKNYLRRPPFKPYIEGFDHRSLVRHVWIPTFLPLSNILSLCPNITHAAVFSPLLKIENLPLKRLTMLSDPRYGGWDTLILAVYIRELTETTFPNDIFPRLTHLAVTLRDRYKHLKDAMFTHLDSSLDGFVKTLDVIVLVFEDRDMTRSERVVQWLHGRRRADPHVHILHSSPSRLKEEWLKEVDGDESIWDKALRKTNEMEKNKANGLIRPFDVMVKDPHAMKIKSWRRQVQKALLSQRVPNEMEATFIDQLFMAIEEYKYMTAQYITFTKLDRVMQHVVELPEARIPQDEEYKFRERAKVLLEKWEKLKINDDDHDH